VIVTVLKEGREKRKGKKEKRKTTKGGVTIHTYT